MAGRLAEKVAVITGAGSGIGRACALRFAEEGAAICAADINLEGAAETVRRLERAGGRGIAVQVDTTQEQAVEAMVARCVEAFGGVDLLVAAAGVLSAHPQSDESPQSNTVLTADADDIRRVLEVNLFGVLCCDRAVARWLLANERRGSIINLSSTAAKIAWGTAGGAYSVSKAGVWMLTKALAQELGPAGIRVNALGPGLVETPMTAPLFEDEAWMRRRMAMTPLGRAGQPEEIANAALFLASDESSYFTGELLHPAGGTFLG